jgi:UDP-GlcNAc:undecaprenyl-phosphate GlcNAc-1-phosphate transferase
MSFVYLIFIISFLAVVVSMPGIRRAGERLGFIAVPAQRNIHTRPIPQIGGIAMWIGALLALLLFFGQQFNVDELVGILASASLVAFTGAWDDRKAIKPITKLVSQIIAALILIAVGVRVNFLPFDWLDWAITIFWVVGISNAMNLLDNMDGLSGGIAAVASAFFLVLAVQSGQYLVGSLSAAMLGVTLGFLVYNFNPASIFMGDSGSLFLGVMLAAIGIKLRFPTTSPVITWMVPVIVLAVPIFDTTLVTISRLRRRISPVTPGTDHTSHRLVRLGYTHKETAMALYLVGGVLGLIALLIIQAELLTAYIILAAVLIAGLLALWRLEQVPVNTPLKKETPNAPPSGKN